MLKYIHSYTPIGSFTDPCAITLRKMGKNWGFTYNHGPNFSRRVTIISNNQEEARTALYLYTDGYSFGKTDYQPKIKKNWFKRLFRLN